MERYHICFIMDKGGIITFFNGITKRLTNLDIQRVVHEILHNSIMKSITWYR